MARTTYPVIGMTCDHCRRAVTQETSAIPGVTSATVDLQAGTVTLEGDGFTRDDVAAAVDEAGFELGD